MNFKNMTVRTRILVTVLLPLMALLLFGGKILLDDIHGRSLARTMRSNVEALQSTSDLIQELQTERGKTALYLSGKITESEMETQRRQTDNRMVSFGTVLKSSHIPAEEKLRFSPEMLKLEENIRNKVGTTITVPGESTQAFVEFIDKLLGLLNVMADQPSVQAISDGMNSIQSLEAAKENAGMARATLSGILSLNKPIQDGEQSKLIKFMGGLQAMVRSRALMLSAHGSSQLAEFPGRTHWQEVDRTAKLILLKGQVGNYGVDPKIFFGSATQVVNDLDALIKSENHELVNICSQLERDANKALLVEVLLLFLVFGITLILSLKMVKLVSTSLHSSANLLKTMADGDFSGRVPPEDLKRGDEFGVLSRATASLLESISAMLGSMNTNAETLATSASELSSVSNQSARIVQTLAEKTTTVAAAAEESSANTISVAASMEQASINLTSVAGATEEMSSTIGEIAANSEKARSISAEAGQVAASVTALMQQLGEAAQEIGKVTETITNISSQTNLLALNATIEAARAGAAGKGFAVVANEIKELAKQTAAATVDIKTKIGGVQDSANSAIRDSEKITGVIAEVGELVSSIATAIEEQAAVTKDLAGNIAQASAGVQDSNERVAQTAAVSKSIAQDISGVEAASIEIRSGGEKVQTSAAELLMLSEQLKDLVGRFTLGEVNQGSEQTIVEKGDKSVLIAWSDRLSVGSDAMDSDHKKLIKLINELYSAIRKKQGNDVLQRLLDGLKEYVQYHFKAEEELMAKVAYPGLQAQQTAHQKFLITVVSMEKRWQAGDKTVISEMMNVLQVWLVDHIMKMDKKYASYVA